MGGGDGGCFVHDIEYGTVSSLVENGGMIQSICVSPHNPEVIYTSSTDGFLRHVDLREGVENIAGAFSSYHHPIRCVSVNPIRGHVMGIGGGVEGYPLD